MALSEEEQIEAAVEMLRERGPMTTQQWAQAMAEAGHGYVGQLVDLLEYPEDPRLSYLADGRHVMLHDLLAGRMLTHRLTEQEIAFDILAASADLAPLTELLYGATEGLQTAFRGLDEHLFTSRGMTDDSWPDGEALVAPRGTFAGYSAGDVVALVSDGNALHLERVTRPLVSPGVGDALAEIVSDGTAHFIDAVIYQLMNDDPSVFTQPSLPLSEILTAADVSVSGELIGGLGFDFEGDRLRHRLQSIGSTYHLTEGESRAVIAFTDLIRDVAGRDNGKAVAAEGLAANPEVFLPLNDSAVAKVAYDLGSYDGDAVARVTAAMLDALPRRAHASAHWMQGRLALKQGRVLDAEASFERVLGADPLWEAALVEAARFSYIRGEITRGLSLLNRVEFGPGLELIARGVRFFLNEALPRNPEGLGRNDKCWCGSGRKFKVCHLNKTQSSTSDLISTIGTKAEMFAIMTGDYLILEELADTRAAHFDSDDAVDEAMNDPFVSDVALVEGGILQSFIDALGSVLPSDEAMVSHLFQSVERTVYEVMTVTPGEGMSLRDIRTGDTVDVVERMGSRQLHVGNFFCSRAIDLGNETQLFGGIEVVAPGQRVPLVELLDETPVDAHGLVEFLSARFAPPQLVTGDGHPMVLCEATIDIPGSAGIKRKLSRRFGAADGQRWTWTEASRVLGGLELDGTTVKVEAMSEPRFEELVDSVLDMDVSARVTTESRTPAAEAMKNVRPRAESAALPDISDPAIAELLDQQIRAYEDAWITESIPALDGLTPLAAVEDPTRREEVIRLLESFPQEERPGAMSVRRLRALLNL